MSSQMWRTNAELFSDFSFGSSTTPSPAPWWRDDIFNMLLNPKSPTDIQTEFKKKNYKNKSSSHLCTKFITFT